MGFASGMATSFGSQGLRKIGVSNQYAAAPSKPRCREVYEPNAPLVFDQIQNIAWKSKGRLVDLGRVVAGLDICFCKAALQDVQGHAA